MSAVVPQLQSQTNRRRIVHDLIEGMNGMAKAVYNVKHYREGIQIHKFHYSPTGYSPIHDIGYVLLSTLASVKG